MSRSNAYADNSSYDLPPSYEDVCSSAEQRGASASTSKKTDSDKKSKKNETTEEISPSAPMQETVEDSQISECNNRSAEDTTVPISDFVDNREMPEYERTTEFDMMSPATRIKRYQQIPQGPVQYNNNARWHQRLRRTLSTDYSTNTKYANYMCVGTFTFIIIVTLIVVFCISHISTTKDSELDYYQSQQYLDYERKVNRLFKDNNYLMADEDAARSNFNI